MIADFVGGRGMVPVEEAEAWARDLRTLGEGYFFSLNRLPVRGNALSVGTASCGASEHASLSRWLPSCG